MVRQVHDTMPTQSWVPWEWQHRVCTCLDTQYHTEKPEEFVGFICKKCEKYFRWVLIPCLDCGNKYLALFNHPEWCPHTHRCLDCIEAGYKNTCEDYCKTSRSAFYPYKFEVDKHPRPLLNLTEVLDSELTFDF